MLKGLNIPSRSDTADRNGNYTTHIKYSEIELISKIQSLFSCVETILYVGVFTCLNTCYNKYESACNSNTTHVVHFSNHLLSKCDVIPHCNQLHVYFAKKIYIYIHMYSTNKICHPIHSSNK